MDIQIRNYILYKARTLNARKKELEWLRKKKEEMRQDIIDESPEYMDGLPRGKGGTSDPTSKKVFRLEDIERRIGTLDKELQAIQRAEEKIRLTGSLSWRIYTETIRGQANLEYKSMEYGMATKTLYTYRTKLIEMIANELGEYIDINKLE